MIRLRALLTFGSILILVLSTAARMRAEEPQLHFQTTVTPSYAPLLIQPARPVPAFVQISCGTGMVRISMQDGAVTFDGDCSPDDGARAFWKAVEVMGAGRCATEPK